MEKIYSPSSTPLGKPQNVEPLFAVVSGDGEEYGAFLSKSQQRLYYFNPNTGESSWNPPGSLKKQHASSFIHMPFNKKQEKRRRTFKR